MLVEGVTTNAHMHPCCVALPVPTLLLHWHIFSQPPLYRLLAREIVVLIEPMPRLCVAWFREHQIGHNKTYPYTTPVSLPLLT